MRKPKTAVLFLESDEILRAGAVSVLEADGRFSVGRARNAAEARLEWSLRPSVLVLPVDREAFDPYAWLALARERAGVKVLLALDPDENPAFVRPLLKRGACGYVERTSDAAKLPELLERVLLEGRVEEGGAVCRALAEYEAVRAKLATREFAAVIIEGIQGVSGIHCPTDDFLRGVRAAATETGTQLILDEIQSGYGRTGRFFAHQQSGIRPDLITTAKGMGNGFPIGGVLIAPHFEARQGMLGTTFGGNHLACAAAIAVLETIEREGLVENAARVGEHLLGELRRFDRLKEVRGRGLMIGVEIDGPGSELRRELLFEKHIFTGGAGASTVRLLPALCLTRELADRFLEAFAETLKK